MAFFICVVLAALGKPKRQINSNYKLNIKIKIIKLNEW